MNITTTPVPDCWVLVLLDNDDDILGIWGPYTSETSAQWAQEELTNWPLDGSWEIVKLKKFAAPASKTTSGLTPRGTWTTDDNNVSRIVYGDPSAHG